MNNIRLLEQIFDFDPANKKHIGYLKSDINRTLPLIGAGMTMSFGYLSLNDLVSALAREWFPNKPEALDIIKNAIESNTIHEAIDTLDKTEYFNGHIQSAVEEYFTKRQPDLLANRTRFNSLEKIINRINSQGTSGTQLILTTNYDNVIECVINEMNKKNRTRIEYDVFSPNNMQKLFDREIVDKLKVLKFHGDYNDKNSLVLTSESFKANYGIAESLDSADIKINDCFKVNKILRKMVGNHSILFLGSSLKEDPFIKLFRNLSTSSMYQHYAILPKPESDNEVRELLTQAIRMNTLVIWIKKDNYDWIDAIVEYVFTLSSFSTLPMANPIIKQYSSRNGLDISESIESENMVEDNEVMLEKVDEILKRKISLAEIAPNKSVISFPMYKIDGGIYKIYLISEDGKFYLSDEGATYAELDKIFELKEPDVVKNLFAILKQYGCRKHQSSNAFTIECTLQDIHVKMSYLIQAISFMLNMKIFYV